MNEYFDCNEELRRLLKNTVESSLLASNQKEMQAIEKRLIEIDNTRNSHISLIANGSADEDEGGCYDKYVVTDGTGRKWTLMSDSSIACTHKNGAAAISRQPVSLRTLLVAYTQ